MKELRVKEWIIDKAQSTATAYNCFIDCKKDENGMDIVEDGFVTVFVEEMISESEKAIQVRLQTGAVVGSYKGWKLWVPKSQIHR